MPAINATKLERDRLIRPLLDFVTELPGRLNDLTSSGDDRGLPSEFHSHINTLRMNGPKLFDHNSDINIEDLDTKAIALWNQCTRIKREHDEATSNPAVDSEKTTKPQYIALVRTFVVLLLDAIFQKQSLFPKSSSKIVANEMWKHTIRLLRIANKSAKSCIECSYAQYGTKVLERGADYVDSLGKLASAKKDSLKDNNGISDELLVFYDLRAEFYTLRMTLAWKLDNLDVADVMFRHASQSDVASLRPAKVVTLSDAAYEIGKALFRKKEYYKASKWLEKAFDVISSREIGDLSFEAEELKFSIVHDLVSALLELNTDADRAKAENFIALLEHNYSGKMAVPLLRFDYMRKDKESDPTQFFNVLNRVIRMMHVTNSNFKLVMGYIQELKELNPEMACGALDDLLNLRLYSHATDTLIHRAFIARLWITIDKNSCSSSVLESLSNLIDSLAANLANPLDVKATHAAQILLWKKIESLYQQKDFKVSESWCRLALHPVFSNAGKSNNAKINRYGIYLKQFYVFYLHAYRKLLLCKLGASDYAGARSAFNTMQEDIKSEPLTRYIMYKVAARNHDSQLAAECLESLARSPLEDSTLLYACVIEAQSVGDKQQAILALRTVLAKYDHDCPGDAHLPSLLRCTARLLMSGIPKGHQGGNAEISDEICKVFEAANTAIQQQKSTTKSSTLDSFTPSELEWFIKSSYNLAIQQYTAWQPSNIIRLLESCVGFLKFYEINEQSGVLGHLSAICHGLAAQQSLKLARNDEDAEYTTKFYQEVRKHIELFRETKSSHIDATMDDIQKVKVKLWSKLLLNNFEAAIRLHEWQYLSKIIEDWNHQEDPKGLESLADMIMGSDAPSIVLFETLDVLFLNLMLLHISSNTDLNKHISKTTNQNSSITHQSRWLRILYQLSLSPEMRNNIHGNDSGMKVMDGITRTDGIVTRVLNLSQATRRQMEEHQLQQRQLHSANAPSSTIALYPAEELEYIATTTYNRAVDAYCATDEKECKRLGEQALRVAEELVDEDGGEWKRVLMRRMNQLLGMKGDRGI